MVLVNYSTRELTAKLVYYGAGLCGKTTNLQYIYDSLLPKDRRGKMVSLSTETDRTLFFDFLPLELGTIRGLKTRLQLYTVPGQVHYNATRKIVLKGADGIVFVADSQPTARQSNIDAFKNMKANLAEHGLDLRNIPHVIQFNKRDLPGCMPVEQMVEDLNEFNAPFFDAVAMDGIGVEDTLKGISKLVLKNLAGRFQSGADIPASAPAESAPAVEAPPIPTPAPAVVAAPISTPAPAVVAPLPPPTPPPTPFVAPAVAAPAPAPWPSAAPAAPAAATWPQPVAPAASVPAASVVPAARPQPAAPAPPPAPAPFAAASPMGSLEDMLLGAPAPAADPFGLGAPATEQSGDLEDILMAGTPAASRPAATAAWPSAEPAAPEPEEVLLSGDTILSTDFEMPPAAHAPLAPAMAAEPAIPEAELLSGDTMLSTEGLGMPTAADYEVDAGSFGREAVLSGDTVMTPMPDMAHPPSPRAPIAMPSGDDEIPLFLEDEVPAEMPLGADDEAGFAMAAPAAAPAAAAAIEIPVPVSLGAATPGEMVERTLRIPLEYQDASGTRRTTLEVTLRFRLG